MDIFSLLVVMNLVANAPDSLSSKTIEHFIIVDSDYIKAHCPCIDSNLTIKPYSITSGVQPGDTTETIWILDLEDFPRSEDNRRTWPFGLSSLTTIRNGTQRRDPVLPGGNITSNFTGSGSPYSIYYVFGNVFFIVPKWRRCGEYMHNNSIPPVYNIFEYKSEDQWCQSYCGDNDDGLLYFRPIISDAEFDDRGNFWAGCYEVLVKDSTCQTRYDLPKPKQDFYRPYEKPFYNFLYHYYGENRSFAYVYAVHISKINDRYYLYCSVELKQDKIKQLHCYDVTNADTLILLQKIEMDSTSYIRRITSDKDCNVYIADAEQNRVLVLNWDLTSPRIASFERDGQIQDIPRPMDLRFIRDTLYVLSCPELATNNELNKKMVSLWRY